MTKEMNYEVAKKIALKLRFGWRALGILAAAENGAVNPYDFFGHSLRRSWAYAYFQRLSSYGFIVETETPVGRRGTWYTLPKCVPANLENV